MKAIYAIGFFSGAVVGSIFAVVNGDTPGVFLANLFLGFSPFGEFVLLAKLTERSRNPRRLRGLKLAFLLVSLPVLLLLVEVLGPYTGGGANIGAGMLLLGLPVISIPLLLAGYRLGLTTFQSKR